MYKGECQVCKPNKEDRINIGEKQEEGIYIGETERSREHVRGMEQGEKENFIVKHWALHHPEQERPPKVRFSLLRNHRDCMSRLIHEASSLN